MATGVPVSLSPAYTSTRTWVPSPAALPAEPLKAGVLSLVLEPDAGAVSAGSGATVSTLKVTGALSPVFPPVADTEACAV